MSTPDAETLPETGPPYQRLHPLTLVHRLAEQVPTLLVLGGSFLFGTARNSEMISTLAIGALSLFLLGPMGILSYLRFRYRITETAVEVASGVFARQHRVIPLGRIQTVEVEQPLLARLLGTARVLLLTGSGAGAEATLAYVRHADALALRRQIRAEASPAPASADAMPDLHAPHATAPGVDDSEAGRAARVLVALTPRRLVRAGLYRVSLRYLAVGITALEVLGRGPADAIDWAEAQPWFNAEQDPGQAVLLIGIGVGLTVVAALVLAWIAGFASTVLRYSGFQLRDDGTRLHVQAGLLSRWERALPRGRVQAFHRIATPFMGRAGFARVEAQTLGVDRAGGFEVLHPLATADEAAALQAAIQPLAPVEAWAAVSSAHTGRRALLYGATVLALLLALAWLTDTPGMLGGVLLLPLLYALARRQTRRHRWALTGDAFHVARGAFWHRTVAVPRARVQTAAHRAGPLQRREGLASVVVDTAGGRAAGLVVSDLPVAEAEALVAALRAEPGQGGLRFEQGEGLRHEPRPVPDEPEVKHGGDGLA